MLKILLCCKNLKIMNPTHRGPPPFIHMLNMHSSCTNPLLNPLFFTYCHTCLYFCLVEPKFQTLFSNSVSFVILSREHLETVHRECSH